MMLVVVFILSIWIFIRTLSYGIYEIKKNKNTIGGIITIVLSVFSLIFPSLIVYINGFY